ncbi:unnamed protein product [Mytilus edulis]|uniref:Uncharacterized protein n=1 Tax=Mytilus edulis TaxID=6550 RepID=A0A8S3QC13_MYTED|nr:unnamed protein product [Mytilus edulis]
MTKKKAIRVGHRGAARRLISKIEEELEKETTQRDEIESLCETLKKKRDILSELDNEILEEIAEENMEAEIEDSDRLMYLNYSASAYALSALKGSSVQLTCPYTATDSSISWSHYSNKYTENNMTNPFLPSSLTKRLYITGNHTVGEYHLNISDIRKSDEGNYQCSASVNVYTTQLTVIVEPVSLNIVNMLPDYKLQGTEGMNLIITCTAIGGQPQPDLKLLISGSTVATGKQSLQHTLPKLSRSYDRMIITCHAGYEIISYFPLMESAKLYLLLKPLLPIFLQKSVGTEETVPLNVSCISHGSRPAANFTWLIGQTSMDVTTNSSETKTFNSSTETFTVISTLTLNVGRTYNRQMVTCKASNIISSNVSSSTLLNIKYAPIPSVENKTFLQTDKIRNVQCSIQGNPSEYTYFKCHHMSYYDVMIREFTIRQSGILSLPEISTKLAYQDSGMYTCAVGNGILGTNGQEKQSGNGFVKINAQPVFANGNVQKINGVFGRTVYVNVYVYSEPKYTTIRWYKNTNLLKQSAKYSMTENMMIVYDDFHGKEVQLDGYRLTLVINELRFEDAAVYKLQLSNGIGDIVEHNLILEIGHIPQTPTNITVVSVGETSFTIQWNHVDNRELHIMYYIEYKLSIASTWIHKEMITKETVNQELLYILAGLQKSTYYDVRILAENSFNKVCHQKLSQYRLQVKVKVIGTICLILKKYCTAFDSKIFAQ